MYPFEQQPRAYEDYANAYHIRDYSRVDPREAMRIVQHFQQSAPPEVVNNLFEHYFKHLLPELRLLFVQQMPVAYQANPNNPRSMAQSFSAFIQQLPGWCYQMTPGGGDGRSVVHRDSDGHGCSGGNLPTGLPRAREKPSLLGLCWRMKERRERLFSFQKEVERRLYVSIFTGKQALLGSSSSPKSVVFWPM
jgi:hypothetical protein